MGVGVVGGAVRNYLELTGIQPLLYDPGKGLGSLKEINEAELVYICVPTPYVAGVGFDDSAVADAISHLRGSKTIVIKSTVLPGTTEKFQRLYPQQTLLFNPEFLRENRANEDFLTPDRQIVGYCGADAGFADRDPGGPAPRAARGCRPRRRGGDDEVRHKLVPGPQGDLWQRDVRSLPGPRRGLRAGQQGISVDKRIGDSHFNVLDAGYRGYGGKCLPKDTMSLLDLADDAGIEMKLLQAAHEVNLRLHAPLPFNRRDGRREEPAEPSKNARLAS